MDVFWDAPPPPAGTWATHSCRLEATWFCSSHRILYRMARRSLSLRSRKRPGSLSSGDEAALRSSEAKLSSGTLRTNTGNRQLPCALGKASTLGPRVCSGDSAALFPRRRSCRRLPPAAHHPPPYRPAGQAARSTRSARPSGFHLGSTLAPGRALCTAPEQKGGARST